MSFIRINYPAGCQAVEICKNCLFQDPPVAHQRQKTYRVLEQLMKDGFLEKPWEGFYRPRQVTDSRRYYLHRRIKRYFKVTALKKQVDYIPSVDIPDRILLQLKELAAYGYNIQTTIA